jgi:hypothetical protein
MYREQPNFEASRKKSDEQFKKQAEDRNNQRSFLEKIKGTGSVLGMDMAHEEAKIVDEFIEKEVSLLKGENQGAYEDYEAIFAELISVYPNLENYDRCKFREMVKERLNKIVSEQAMIKEGRDKLHKRKDAQLVIVMEFFKREYGYLIEDDLKHGHFSAALKMGEKVEELKLKEYGVSLAYVKEIISKAMIPAQINELIETRNSIILTEVIAREEDAKILLDQIATFISAIPQGIVKPESFNELLQDRLLQELSLEASERGLKGIRLAEEYVRLGLMEEKEKEAFFASDDFRESLKDAILATFEQVFSGLKSKTLDLKKNTVEDFNKYLDFCLEKGVLKKADCALLENKFLKELDSDGEVY